MKSHSGFSLVELMVALFLGLIVMSAVSSVFITSNKTNSVQDNMGRLQENARFALSSIETDIRMAGYRGCLGQKGPTSAAQTTPVNNIINGINYNNNLASSIQGYFATGGGWAPGLDNTIIAALPAPTPGSDVITVRMAVGTGTPLSTAMTSPTVDIPIAGNVDNITAGATTLIADCTTSTVFVATGVSAATISHASGSNTTTSVGRSFGTDAVVMPVSTITYYVGPSNDLAGGQSLFRMINGGVSQELADNVEQLRILYGEDTNGDISPDHYVTANNVVNMQNVISVKLMLLMRTPSDNLSANGQFYTFNGQAAIAPPDKRIRKVFSSVITIRNRAT